MAITKTKTVQRIEVYPAMDSSADATTNEAHERVMVVYEITFDDSEDATLPVATNSTVYLSKFDPEGNATSTSGEDTLVQTICSAIWS